MDIQLVNPSVSRVNLRKTMQRVGTMLTPQEFIQTVSNAYHAVEAQHYAADMPTMFINSGSQKLFKTALEKARDMLTLPISILNIGCGTGYDLEVLEQVFSKHEIKHVLATDISADLIALCKQKTWSLPIQFIEATFPPEGQHFDLVLTHSLVHHIAELGSFLEHIQSYLSQGGLYMMGHEPNNRYYVNQTCQQQYELMRSEVSSHRSLTKLFEPMRYINRVNRILFGQDLPQYQSITQLVNQKLRQQHAVSQDLTELEIHRLVDIHIPFNELDGDFTIGQDGLNWEEMLRDWLTECSLVYSVTFGYMGKTPIHVLPAKWQQIDRELAQAYPLDGAYFHAVFQKQ